MTDFLKESFSKIDIDLDDRQVSQFNSFHNTLCEWNEYMNLTGITEYNEVVIKHFVDSVIGDLYFDFNGKTLIDVGTGAGFPGIPLKIVHPSLKITLLDSLNKRINFLNEVIRVCDLKDIDALHGRAEDFGHNKDFREQYDVCVSRAVANMATLCEYCLPFIKVGGKFIAYKAGNSEDEIKESQKAVSILGGEIEVVHKLTIPGTDISRAIVIVKKVNDTPKKYPRKAGTPSKEPLV